ncbi:NUMOD4 domain-containing protein [Sphingobacterium psychroaquaticum]|uniref:HNH endonuclease n=1 Tax=Sphingobacterium psychroaquaticum TaxID=561061 RepID=A0A1X7JTX1_9SPHI|nr:NUMOD4 domain-containing protein [Sphingobacterium psychroaquaticum]SMG31814.1 HNH endonuclease [Sphingobacterium psychroaquaticum]
MEVWTDINGYEGYYQVSNVGNVKSIERVVTEKGGKKKSLVSTMLKCAKYKNGYHFVVLCKNSVRKQFSLHRLVALHFIPNSNMKLEVNHIDEDKSNNSASNLEWISHKDNINHGTAISRRVKNSDFRGEKNPMYGRFGAANPRSKPIYRIDDCGRIISRHESSNEAAREFNLNPSSIIGVLNGRIGKTKGFKFRRA